MTITDYKSNSIFVLRDYTFNTLGYPLVISTHFLFSYSQVEFWKSKVDRQCIERLKAFQNPPILVGSIMEMVFTLIGKKTPPRHDRHENYPSKEDQSGRYSASSSSTKLTQKKSECHMGI